MLFFICLVSSSKDSNISFYDHVQLSNKYTSTKLSTTVPSEIQSYMSFGLFASALLFDNGWIWTIYPGKEGDNYSDKAIQCGQPISLFSIPNSFFLSAKKDSTNNIILTSSKKQFGSQEEWIIECRNSTYLETDSEFLLKNNAHSCYLSVSLNHNWRYFYNRFELFCSKLNTYSIWSISGNLSNQTNTSHQANYSDL